VPELKAVHALRVVAEAAALDAAVWTGPAVGQVTILRVAPDEAIAIDALEVEVADDHAIVVHEDGLVVATCDLADIQHHVDWPLPTERPALAQGAVAGVPAKVLIRRDGSVDLYTWAAYGHELATRLGWLR
jgi:hypothetical protein